MADNLINALQSLLKEPAIIALLVFEFITLIANWKTYTKLYMLGFEAVVPFWNSIMLCWNIAGGWLALLLTCLYGGSVFTVYYTYTVGKMNMLPISIGISCVIYLIEAIVWFKVVKGFNKGLLYKILVVIPFANYIIKWDLGFRKSNVFIREIDTLTKMGISKDEIFMVMGEYGQDEHNPRKRVVYNDPNVIPERPTTSFIDIPDDVVKQTTFTKPVEQHQIVSEEEFVSQDNFDNYPNVDFENQNSVSQDNFDNYPNVDFENQNSVSQEYIQNGFVPQDFDYTQGIQQNMQGYNTEYFNESPNIPTNTVPVEPEVATTVSAENSTPNSHFNLYGEEDVNTTTAPQTDVMPNIMFNGHVDVPRAEKMVNETPVNKAEPDDVKEDAKNAVDLEFEEYKEFLEFRKRKAQMLKELEELEKRKETLINTKTSKNDKVDKVAKVEEYIEKPKNKPTIKSAGAKNTRQFTEDLDNTMSIPSFAELMKNDSRLKDSNNVLLQGLLDYL